jgi:four helix bundle protein
MADGRWPMADGRRMVQRWGTDGRWSSGDFGMNYKRFEDLPVWQTAIDLSIRTYRLTGTGCFKGHSGLRDQIERAAQSVSNNIAEGFERGTHAELLNFLYIALGSAGEVRSMTYTLGGLQELDSRRTEVEALRSLTQSISRQLNAWIERLKNSDSTGPRHRNDATRQAAQKARRQAEFLDELRRIQVQAGTQAHRGDDQAPT